jgi:hypothetical protein
VWRFRTILLFAPACVLAGLWVASYWRFVYVSRSTPRTGVNVTTDRGALYVTTFQSVRSSSIPYWRRGIHPITDDAPFREASFSVTPQRWKPVRVLGGAGRETTVVVQWWAITLGWTVIALWGSRRRPTPEAPGFEVTVDGEAKGGEA